MHYYFVFKYKKNRAVPHIFNTFICLELWRVWKSVWNCTFILYYVPCMLTLRFSVKDNFVLIRYVRADIHLLLVEKVPRVLKTSCVPLFPIKMLQDFKKLWQLSRILHRIHKWSVWTTWRFYCQIFSTLQGFVTFGSCQI